MNITVYLGANEGNDPFLKETVRESWERGSEQTEILLYMAVQNPV